MRILLTGATGNLGSELCSLFLEKNHSLVLTVRSIGDKDKLIKIENVHKKYGLVPEYIECDLTKDSIPLDASAGINYVVHASGVVRFKDAQDNNEQMARIVAEFVTKFSLPVCYVSTAYLYKKEGEPFNNQYEIDKRNAEIIFQKLSTPVAIVAPSIIVGNSISGQISNFSGYYTVIKAIVRAMQESEKVFRFPRFNNGKVNIVPVDYVAKAILDVVENKKIGYYFAINPSYTSFDDVVEKSLSEIGIQERIDFLDCSLEEYQKMELRVPEQQFLSLALHFIPYWNLQYVFPSTVITKSFYDVSTLVKPLTQYFHETKLEK